MIRRSALRAIAGICLAGATAPLPAFAAPAPARVAIVHGRLLTVTHGVIEDGTLVMADGKIVAVGGPGVKVPEGAQILDAKGATVYPGLFDVGATIGLTHADSSEVATATDAPPGTPTPWGFIADVLQPTDQIAIERYNGLTTAVITAGSHGPLPGHAAVIELLDEKDRLVVDRDAGLEINFEGRRDVYPTTVFGIVGYVRQLLTRAREIAAGAEPRSDDAAAQAFVPYLQGRKRVIAHVRNDTEVADALDLARDFDLKLVLVGLVDVDKEIDRIAASGFPVVVGMLFDDPQPGRRFDYIYRLPSRMLAKGISVSIGSVGTLPGGPRNLPYQAGAAAAFGMTHEEALRAITLAPAAAFGLGDQLGSLDAGKRANVVLADGDPLDVKTTVRQVYIGGVPVDMTNRQTRLRDQYWRQ